MEDVLKLIEGYGLSLVLLLGCLYALYRFFWFSVREVKDTFADEHAKKNKVLAEINNKLDVILELLRNKSK
jgi:hypothetical protein